MFGELVGGLIMFFRSQSPTDQTVLAILSLALLVFSGCRSSDKTARDTQPMVDGGAASDRPGMPNPGFGAAQVSAALSSADDLITRVSLSISGADFELIDVDLAIDGDRATSLVAKIPAGSDRLFELLAFVGAEQVCAGSATADVLADTRVVVEIELQCEPVPLITGSAEVVGHFNYPPVIDSASASAASVIAGGTIELSVTASDPNTDDDLTFKWTAGGGVFDNNAIAAPSWIAPATSGDVIITIVVSDGSGASVSLELSIEVSDGHLLISEVFYDTLGTDSQQEWVELFNPTTRPISLSGWTLADEAAAAENQKVFPDDAVVAANSTFVWARNAEAFAELYGFAPDLGGLTLSLNNGGDLLVLRGESGEIVDFVAFELSDVTPYDDGDWSTLEVVDGAISRQRLGDSDGPDDWQSDVGQGQPGIFAHRQFDYTAPQVRIGPARQLVKGVEFEFVAELSAIDPSLPGGVPALEYSWDFGTGSDVVTGETVDFSYQEPGTYTVTLEVLAGQLTSLATTTILVTSATPPAYSVYANAPPNELGIDLRAVDFIGAATSSVHAALFQLGREAVVDALVAAAAAGLDVAVVSDGDFADDPSFAPQYNALETAGIAVVFDDRSAFMHHKFIVADGQRVWTGSYNPTDNGTAKNANNAIVVDDPEVAAAYEIEFDEMYSNDRFGSQKTTSRQTSFTVDGVAMEVLFAPVDNTSEAIAQVLGTADHSVHFCSFVFTHEGISSAVVGALDAGVTVAGVLDPLQAGASDPESVYSILDAAGASLQLADLPGLLHHKFFVIDVDSNSDPTVITGSFNFSASAAESNDENLMIIHDSAVARAYFDIYHNIVEHHSK